MSNSLADEEKHSVTMYVVEVAPVVRFDRMNVEKEKDSMKLFKDSNVYKAVLFPPRSDTAFVLYRMNDKSEARKLFEDFEDKYSVMRSGHDMKLLTRDWLQQFSVLLRSNRGWTAAHLAAKMSLTKWFKDAPDDSPNVADKATGKTPLQIAVETENIECIKAVVESGAYLDVVYQNGDTIFLEAARCGNKTVIQCLNELAHGEMIKRRTFKYTIGLLVKGASAAINGDNALHMAVQTDDPSLVQLLIVFGADVNGLNAKDESPRHKAATENKPNRDYIIYLLHHVGAKRCTANMTGCNEGCKHDGHGTPKIDKQKQITVVDGVIAEVVQAAVQTPTKGDRVLCMDGGGIRGLILIQLLWAIHEKLQKPIRECFDWIGGTSTGGILALAIVHGKTIRECLNLYFQLKDAVFDGLRPYDAEPLEGFLKREFGATPMSERKKPRVMVTGVLADRSPVKFHLFRNYVIPGATTVHSSNLMGPHFQPLPPPDSVLSVCITVSSL